MVQGQIQETLLRRRHCPECGKTRHSKGHHDNTIRTLFGNIELQSSRLEHCRCQVHVEKTHGAAVAHRLEDSKYLPSFGVAFTRLALERTRPLAGPRLALMAWGGSTRACGEQTPLQETTSQMKRRAGYCETCAPGGWSRSTGTKWRSGSDCVDRHKRCRETKHLATQASSFRCGEDGSRGVV